jgi:STAM-binding protein
MNHGARLLMPKPQQARIYENEGNDQQAYLLLMRYATLVAENLSVHPSAKDPENKRALKAATRAIPDVVTSLEILKPRIESRYEAWQIAQKGSNSIPDFGGGPPRSRTFDLAESDPAIAGNASTIAAAEHRELAVQLAHKEIRRRDAARRATRQAGISEEEEHERRTAGLWDNWESALSSNGPVDDEFEQRRRMEDTRRRVDGPQDARADAGRKRLSKSHRTTAQPTPQIARPIGDYRYPSISKSQPLHYEDRQMDLRSSYANDALPPVPAKERLYSTEINNIIAPARPEKQPIYESPSPTPSPVHEASAYTFKPSAYLENGSPLRTLWLPNTLRERFLSIAAPNTRANLETCGILCGTLISNALFISKLVIPEQESTSDTCETVNESALFDYCDAEDLMVLGWIHTHPTQTCFMSSRDLHTHCGYQVMMPESIAIVCAPSKSPS